MPLNPEEDLKGNEPVWDPFSPHYSSFKAINYTRTPGLHDTPSGHIHYIAALPGTNQDKRATPKQETWKQPKAAAGARSTLTIDDAPLTTNRRLRSTIDYQTPPLLCLTLPCLAWLIDPVGNPSDPSLGSTATATANIPVYSSIGTQPGDPARSPFLPSPWSALSQTVSNHPTTR